jgi:hypothetical protein
MRLAGIEDAAAHARSSKKGNIAALRGPATLEIPSISSISNL